jgi:hypothetical protein
MAVNYMVSKKVSSWNILLAAAVVAWFNVSRRQDCWLQAGVLTGNPEYQTNRELRTYFNGVDILR